HDKDVESGTVGGARKELRGESVKENRDARAGAELIHALIHDDGDGSLSRGVNVDVVGMLDVEVFGRGCFFVRHFDEVRSKGARFGRERSVLPAAVVGLEEL